MMHDEGVTSTTPSPSPRVSECVSECMSDSTMDMINQVSDQESDQVSDQVSDRVSECMSEEDFLIRIKHCVTHNEVLDLAGQMVQTSSPIKLARSESLHLRNGTLIGAAHSVFSLGTDRGYANGPPALILEGVRV
jgi:hypothetical protein